MACFTSMTLALGPELPQAIIEFVEQANLGDARHLIEILLLQGLEVQLFQFHQLVQDFLHDAGEQVLVVIRVAQLDAAAPAQGDGLRRGGHQQAGALSTR